jgi:BirA family transcriptional regulator, biotin operon repressor / biotin---[acetyl-CoA-carboxylase] ligase
LTSSRSDRHDPTAAGGPYRHALDRAHGRLGRLASAVFHYETLGSTNDAAAALAARSDAEGLVVVADEQTAGRGRRGRAWFSPPAAGLYVSVVLTPARAAANPMRATRLLTLAAGIALVEAIHETSGLSVDLKWPNDLCAGGRKIAGILAEGVSSGSMIDPIVLGYGINVRAVRYPPELAGRVTSLETELGRGVDREQLFVGTLTALARRYGDLLRGAFDDILDAWRRHAPGACGSRVRWDGHSGITTGIDDEGALLVRIGERTERIVAGELEWQI